MTFKKAFPTWVLPVLIVMAVGTVWVRLKIVRTTYEINETEKMLSQGRHEQEKLELQVAQLRSPRRLELLAKSRFHLNPPKSDQVVHLSHFKKEEP